MYGFKYTRGDLQGELLRRAQADRVAFTVDPNGFVVVDAEDDHLRLEGIRTSIDKRLLIECWYFGAEGRDKYEKERAVNVARGVPFHEYETISDPPAAWRRRPGAPSIWHMYCLAIRNESSLPKGQRPWDRK